MRPGGPGGARAGRERADEESCAVLFPQAVYAVVNLGIFYSAASAWTWVSARQRLLPRRGHLGCGSVVAPGPGVVAIAADSGFPTAGRVHLQLGGLWHQLPLHELHGKAVFHRRWQPCRRGN